MLNRFVAVILLLPLSAAFADWRLVEEASSLSFVTIKNGLVIEAHKFNGLTGNVDMMGNAELKVRLASIDTENTLRDQRLEEILFEVAKFAQATYAVTVNLADISVKLKPGDTLTYDLQGQLNLHGITQILSSKVSITRLNDDAFQVSSIKPVIVSAGDFALMKGIEKLQELAGLASITPMIAVSFSLVFKEYDFKQN